MHRVDSGLLLFLGMIALMIAALAMGVIAAIGAVNFLVFVGIFVVVFCIFYWFFVKGR